MLNFSSSKINSSNSLLIVALDEDQIHRIQSIPVQDNVQIYYPVGADEAMDFQVDFHQEGDSTYNQLLCSFVLHIFYFHLELNVC